MDLLDAAFASCVHRDSLGARAREARHIFGVGPQLHSVLGLVE
jgi:hypothetical protein